MDQVPERAGLTIKDRLSVFLDNLKPYVEVWRFDRAEKQTRHLRRGFGRLLRC
jgi:hypothetical protein